MGNKKKQQAKSRENVVKSIAANRLQSAQRQFDAHFFDVYKCRWKKLREALLQPVSHVVRINGFADLGEVCFFGNLILWLHAPCWLFALASLHALFAQNRNGTGTSNLVASRTKKVTCDSFGVMHFYDLGRVVTEFCKHDTVMLCPSKFDCTTP